MDLVLFGIQGSGKGTQAKRLAAEHTYIIFETGAELRRMAASGTELGNRVASYIDHGHLAPLEIVMEVVRSAVASYPRDQKILFDGIPRDIDQMTQFNALMADLGRPFKGVHLLLDPSEAFKRIQQRALEQGRADDANEEFIRRRMGIFHQKTLPVIEAYKQQGNMMEVDGNGTMDEVYHRLEKAITVPSFS